NNSATDTDTLINCGSPIVLVPDGRQVRLIMPAGGVLWFMADLGAGFSYSLASEGIVGAPPADLTVFSEADGCSGTSTLLTRDVSSIEPRAAGAARQSFTVSGPGARYRARLGNTGSATSMTVTLSETTL